MSDRPFRFGIGLSADASMSDWQHQARAAEDLGYDVIMVSDHLGMAAPFPALTALAAVTTRPRLGTFVLNTGFYKPALLARDVSSTDLPTGGRLELGLGTGWAQDEFADAELPFPPAGQRIAHVERTITELRRRFATGNPPVLQQPAPPILVACRGDRLLAMAAANADIISLAGVDVTERPVTEEAVERALADRIEFIRAAAGRPIEQLELGLTIMTVHLDGKGMPDLTTQRMFAPGLSDDELLALPGVLHGSPDDIAGTLECYRRKYHLTHFVVPATAMADFAEVIDRLR
ncbi:TIGR03621 family F420-dependent LLM class oxidoreductase [Nocardia arthritidis]|uniref:TIGR03621 family F420-dependent LLM class oxidoreductase n=1 Tax=Nocardia arthritidis TaxID=228602 RepID=UPI001EEC5B54|nr:TIGR03621 family F420-dependent LLM class oxidoreductase [Nocardia arthritidis]